MIMKRGATVEISRKIKTIIICVAYVVAIMIQLFAFTPYTITQTYISSQNVPHTVTTDRGYASFEDADGLTVTDLKGVTERKRVNYKLFAFQLALTTAIAAFVCYFWCYKKAVAYKTCDNEDNNTSRELNNQLQETIDKLSSQINKITLENEALRSQISTLIRHQATEELSENEQFSFFDVLLPEPPYLDLNSLAFADEETVQRTQKKYAEDLYTYIKCRIDREKY